jgi:hypothetical protein
MGEGSKNVSIYRSHIIHRLWLIITDAASWSTDKAAQSRSQSASCTHTQQIHTTQTLLTLDDDVKKATKKRKPHG